MYDVQVQCSVNFRPQNVDICSYFCVLFQVFASTLLFTGYLCPAKTLSSENLT